MSDEVQKDDKVTKFITDVVDVAIGRVQESLDKGSASSWGLNAQNSPLVDSRKLKINLSQFHKVSSVGGKISAAALAELFMTYAHSLTSIARANLTVRRYLTPSAGDPNRETTSSSVGYSGRITALNANFRLAESTFNASVKSGVDPFTNLEPGNPAAASAIDALISKLNTVLQTRAYQNAGSLNLSTVSVRACHTSCHGSCHGSRGRR